MIFITARFRVRPEVAATWPDLTRSVTEAARSEPGCLRYDWSRSLDDPNEYVLIEAFRDGEAATARVTSTTSRTAQRDLPNTCRDPAHT